MAIEAFDRVHLDGTGIDRITEDEVVAVVRESLARGRGGRIITPNVDILRRVSVDPDVRRHLDDADLIVADGMPLVWASRLGGSPLPERVAGSSLIWSLAAGLGRDTRSIFVIGGTPCPTPAPAAVSSPAARTTREASATRTTREAAANPAARIRTTAVRSRAATARAHATIAKARAAAAKNDSMPEDLQTSPVADKHRVVCGTPAAEGKAAPAADGRAAPAVEGGAIRVPDDGAARAAARLARASPGLRIAGALSPAYGFEEDEAGYAEVCDRVIAARPDLVFVGLGFPKQEVVIERLRPELPNTWFVGCGAAVNFVAGDVARAPRWMQRTGLEWAHRLGAEPRRLAGRYLRHDAPYALRLLVSAPRSRS
ncbi:WecB/TagA/CpsF family glycosyltransferase [Actinoplanes derwentensis]|uniref:Polymer biosynthesis protein, WecB/TagA/CpsF family n=1 Tax=Actinoplanes derwentensis TaxID=113562 RepID=A0A1H2CJS1_9ACTN|nr:WecB/TagA/CpsF family glycosyltransferase [Actinoplanes derwentensis]GID82633.1 hypothetical protein Ade03nite_15570 [Actinoplanes derwentensis]SDT70740.1 polymer biosynthesis protein, WecB/TagA/CpsF family [Actinoplanes derwentensis]